MEHLGFMIKERRELMSLTQEKLAQKADVSQSTISRLEKNDSNVRLLPFIKVLQVLNMEASDVITLDTVHNTQKYMAVLDEARRNNDNDRIRKILMSKSVTFWGQTPELHLYRIWHEAILLYRNNSKQAALVKLEKIIFKYQENKALYEILAMMSNNKGNMYQHNDKKINAYKFALKFYKESQRSNYCTYVDILLNLANTYCKLGRASQVRLYTEEAQQELLRNQSSYKWCELILLECNAHYTKGETKQCLEKINGSKSFFEYVNQLDKWEEYQKLFSSELHV